MNFLCNFYKVYAIKSDKGIDGLQRGMKMRDGIGHLGLKNN